MGEREFVKLVRGDDWGHVYYRLPETKGTVFGTFGASEHGVQWRHLIGKDVVVRWPNGTDGKAKIGIKREHGSIPDHGHSYDYTTEYPVLLVDINGVEARVLLEHVEVLRSEWAGGE